MWYWFQRRCLQCVIALTLLWCITIWIVSKEVPLFTRYFGVGVTSTSNLKLILTEWIIQQYEDSENAAFDEDLAKKRLRPRPSSWTEQEVARREFALVRALTAAPFYGVPTLIYTALLIPFVRRRPRKAMVAVVAMLVILLILSAVPQSVADAVFPSRYAFIQDYVYVSDVDLTSNPNPGNTIAAYDWRSFQGPNRMRIIGFADGHVMRMQDREARQAFATSGLGYPDGLPQNP